jgi:putative heme degradation protein
MTNIIKPHQEHQDIPDDLRRVLEESREVSYENYGEKKVVSVKHGNRTYKFYPDSREHADWAMDIYDEKGEYIESVDIREDADVKYIEELFKQDIRDNLRRVLEKNHEVSHEDYGDKKVISVKHGNRTYKFYPDSREHAEWAMDIYDENGEYIESVDIREDADVKYLEELFNE